MENAAAAIVKAPAQIFRLPYSQIVMIFVGLIVLRLLWIYSEKVATKAEGAIAKGAMKAKASSQNTYVAAINGDPTAGML